MVVFSLKRKQMEGLFVYLDQRSTTDIFMKEKLSVEHKSIFLFIAFYIPPLYIKIYSRQYNCFQNIHSNNKDLDRKSQAGVYNTPPKGALRIAED